MNVTKVKWNRKALRAVHHEPGVGTMLEDLGHDVVGNARFIFSQAGADRTGTYKRSFRVDLITRSGGKMPGRYYIVQVRNTAPYAQYIEFGTSRSEAMYPLTRAVNYNYGPR